jgi:RNA polymerase sigma-70 factor (ECF subfamily)
MELKQLLKECKQNSVTAQKYLYDTVSLQMFIICRRYLKSNEVAEEVMMNGFLKVFQQIQQFEYQNDGATINWIKKIMINECLQVLRKKTSFLTVEEKNAAEISVDEDALATLSASEILILITQLPIGYRTVFNLYILDDMSHKEISMLLGISEGTSKSQLSKAKQMLQQLLIKNNPDHAARKAQ